MKTHTNQVKKKDYLSLNRLTCVAVTLCPHMIALPGVYLELAGWDIAPIKLVHPVMPSRSCGENP